MEGDIVSVRMAEMSTVRESGRLKTILGSCVGVILYDPARRISGMAHAMLPRRVRGDTAVGKYADTAIPALLALVRDGHSRAGALRAYLVGGATMFAQASPKLASIGDQNVSAAREALHQAAVPIVFEDIGGTRGRSVLFDNQRGDVSVHTLSPVATTRGTE